MQSDEEGSRVVGTSEHGDCTKPEHESATGRPRFVKWFMSTAGSIP